VHLWQFVGAAETTKCQYHLRKSGDKLFYTGSAERLN